MSDNLFHVRDLGSLQGPVLIFGGPYSHFLATKAMREMAASLSISDENIICTGDVVAYAGEPAETTNAIMDWGITTVMGNCEESFGGEADDCGCGFEEGTACDVMSRQWYAYANAELNPEQRAWMRGLPGRVTFSLNDRRFAVVHGSAASINEFVFEGTDDTIKQRDLSALDVDAIIGGHAGVPYTQALGDRIWHNAGVIGMPANDGTPRVWFSVIRPSGDDIEIEICPLDYDHAAAAASMRDKRLPESYAKCMEDGLWPNMDIMPEAEHAKAGVAIAPSAFRWLVKQQVAAE